MLPATHRRLIERALAQLAEPELSGCRTELLRGCDDEDVLRVPVVGWRLQSPGLSHTYRPGQARGELGMPSALTRLTALRRHALVGWYRARGDAAHALGRSLHLLGDVAVPARARGVWHPLGDPYERWVEDHLDELAALPPATVTPTTVAAVVDDLARAAASHPADTTRSPWGALAARLGRPAVRLDASEAERQARALWPLALAHHIAYLRGFVAELRPPLRTGSR